MLFGSQGLQEEIRQHKMSATGGGGGGSGSGNGGGGSANKMSALRAMFENQNKQDSTPTDAPVRGRSPGVASAGTIPYFFAFLSHCVSLQSPSSTLGRKLLYRGALSHATAVMTFNTRLSAGDRDSSSTIHVTASRCPLAHIS